MKLFSNIPVLDIVLNVKSLNLTNLDFSLPLKVLFILSPLRLAMNVDNLFHPILLKLTFVKHPANPYASSLTLNNAA